MRTGSTFDLSTPRGSRSISHGDKPRWVSLRSRRLVRVGRPLQGVVLAALVLGPAWLGNTAQASCGLSACPVGEPAPSESASATGETVHLPQTLRIAKFTLNGVAGHYAETLVRAEYRGLGNSVFGVLVPLVVLMTEDSHFGLANPLAMAEWRYPVTDLYSVALGAQVEFPVGDTEHGIASDHAEILPYGRIALTWGRLFAGADVGVRVAVASGDHSHHDDHGHDHHHDHDHDHVQVQAQGMQFVNPHTGLELSYRAIAGGWLVAETVRAGLFVDGQQVLEQTAQADPRTFITGGTEVAVRINSAWDVHISGELPLTSPGRIDWRTGFGVTLRL